MKYLVKNVATKEETLCEKVEVDGHDYYVNDSDFTDGNRLLLDYPKGLSISEPLNNQPFNNVKFYKSEMTYDFLKHKKVIATNNKSLDLPQVLGEVEELAKSEHSYNHKSVQEIGFRLGFVMGYKQAKETYQFTKEDMVEWFNWCEKYKGELNNWKVNNIKVAELFDTVQLFLEWQEQRTITISVK